MADKREMTAPTLEGTIFLVMKDFSEKKADVTRDIVSRLRFGKHCLRRFIICSCLTHHRLD